MSTIRKRSRKDDEDDASFTNSVSNNQNSGNQNKSRGSRGGGGGGGGSHDDLADLELFVGNIKPGTSEEEFERFVANALKQVNLIPSKGSNPVKNCRLNAKYGFIEFYTSEVCTLALNLNGIPFHGVNLKFGRPAKYSGNVKQGSSTWQELLAKAGNNSSSSSSNDNQRGRDNQHQHQHQDNNQRSNTDNNNTIVATPHFRHPAYDPATKVYRDIFVGGTTPDMNAAEMKEFLGNAMLKLGMSNSGLENPVLEARNNGKYAFLIMRTVEDAANVMNLNYIPFMKHQLKMERPSKFDGAIAGISYYNFDELYKLHMNGELKLMTSGPPSKIIVMKNMASIQEIQQDTGLFIDLVEETRLECSQHGRVLNVIIPRTINEITNEATSCTSNLEGNIVIDANSNLASYVPCKVFIEMASIEEAKQVILNMKGKTFNNKFVDMKFYPEEKFRKVQYNYEAAGVIVTSSFGPVFKEQALNAAALARIWASSNPEK